MVFIGALSMRFFLFICFFIGMNCPGVNAESSFNGDWVVESVQIDRLAERKQQYVIDDPRLKGRIFKFSEDVVVGPNSVVCKEPAYSEKSRSSVALINQTFNANEKVMADIGMQLPTNALVFYISCSQADSTRKLEERNWVLKLAPDKLLINSNGPTVLLLVRLESNKSPVPGFDCGKASGYIEKNICTSHELALFDKSLKQAYGMISMELSDAQKANFKARQLAWLKDRNLCKDLECIKKSYESRLEEIMNESSEL